MSENSPNLTVLQACRVLLRPVFRLALKSGISWKQFADVARTAMVEVATRDFGKRGRPTNVSRVAILTGVNRRDVRRIREDLAAQAAPNEGYLSPARRVLSAWHLDRDYLGADGLPAALPPEGPSPSFETLMRTHGGDVPPVALLKELLAVEAVERLADGRVRAIKRFYVPRQLDPAKTMRGASAMADIGNTIEFNLTADATQKSRFERRASNEAIDPRHLPAFREFLESEGMQFLERVDAWLTEHQARNDGGVRLGVGVYQVQDDEQRSRQR
jgi:hypothetical protein